MTADHANEWRADAELDAGIRTLLVAQRLLPPPVEPQVSRRIQRAAAAAAAHDGAPAGDERDQRDLRAAVDEPDAAWPPSPVCTDPGASRR
jgi:hypothetical protein